MNTLKRQHAWRTNARRWLLLPAGALLLVSIASLAQAIPPTPDLAVTKDDNADPVQVGDTVRYYINITNIGDAPAVTFTVEDTLPAGSTLLAVSPSTGCQRSPGAFSCTTGPLAPRAWYNLTVDVRMDTPGEKVNNVGVRTLGDRNQANNGDSEATRVVGNADLHVEKTDVQDPVYLGSNIEWIVNVSNEGNLPAGNVTVVDVAPTGVAFVSVTPPTGCSRGPPGTLTCNIGTLAPGAWYEIRIVGTPTLLGPHVNVATVAPNATEIDEADNTAEETTTVLPRPRVDLALTKDDLVDPVLIGENITYLINVTNVGRATVHNVTVTDQLPEGVRLLAVTPAAGCERFSGGFRCNVGTLDAGENITLRVVVRADRAGVLTNGATVDPGDGAVDDDRSNNAQREQTTVTTRPPADLTCIAQADEDILVSWSAAAGATDYDIYRSVDGGEFAFLATTTGTSYEDQTTVVGQTYAYYVVSISAGGASAPSETCSATAIPFFTSALGMGLAVVGGVLAMVGIRRWRRS